MNIHLIKSKGLARRYLWLGLMLSLLVGLALVADFLVSSPRYSKKEPMMKRISESRQYDQGTFRNANPWDAKVGDMLATLGEYISSETPRKPQLPLPMKRADIKAWREIPDDSLGSIWLGHSTVLLRLNGYHLLLDPVLEPSVSIVGPKRYNGSVPLDPADLPGLDVVIISHNHYDHMNKASLLAVAGRTRRFVCPLGLGAHLKRWGIQAEKIVELDWWQSFALDEGLILVATPAQHFSGRGLRDRNRTLWASWVIMGPRHRVFFSGDSGYFKGFRDIGEQYGPFDLTFLECGAYNPRWHPVHMYPEETVMAHLDLRGGILHPVHWGTFNLSLHAWYDPMVRVVRAAGKASVRLATPIVGDLYRPGQETGEWWRRAMD